MPYITDPALSESGFVILQVLKEYNESKNMEVFVLRKMKVERHKDELGSHRLWTLIDIQYLMNISK